MSIEKFNASPELETEDRSLLSALLRGVQGKCPCCGESKLFSGGLQVEKKCTECAEELHHHRADDLPAYLNIFVIGHIVVAASMIAMDLELMSMWSLVISACLLAVALAALLMRPLKGMVVGVQWALRMHGFGGHDD